MTLSLAASVFPDGDTYDGDLLTHPLTRETQLRDHVPRWVVMLLELAESAGCPEGERLRDDYLDAGDRSYYDDDPQRKYLKNCIRIFAYRFKEAGVATITGNRLDPLHTCFDALFQASAERKRVADRAYKHLRIRYPGGRYARSSRTAQQEFVARAAQALGVYDAKLHGNWLEFQPRGLQRRILKLALFLVADRLHTLDDGDLHKDLALERARESIPLLLNACALAETAAYTPSAPMWQRRRTFYVEQLDALLLSVVDGDIGDGKGRVEVDEDEDEDD